MDACSGLNDADISHAIRQATGPRSPLFVPEASFEVLARRQIALLRPYCLQAVEQVLGEMQTLLPVSLPQQVTRYAHLHARMQQCAHRLLSRREAATSEMVNHLLDIELAYLNTSHPDFVGGGTAMRLVAQQLHAAADEQQYRAELEGPRGATPTNPAHYANGPAGASPAYGAPSPGYDDGGRDLSGNARGAAASDPLSEPAAAPGAGEAFLNSFFGTGSSSTAKKEPSAGPWGSPPATKHLWVGIGPPQ